MPIKTVDKPVLYDYAGREIRGVPDLDPYFLRGGRTGGTGLSSTPAAREPYKYHSWIYACVDRIVTPLTALPRMLVTNEKATTKKIESHPLLDLFMNPNPQMCGSDLWEATYLALLLPSRRTPGGQCFWVLESGRKGDLFDVQSGDMPAEIWPYTDNFMQPVIDAGQLVGWKMEMGGRTIQTFGLNEVIRIRKYNPYNVAQGLSPYAPAEIPVVQDVKSDEYNTQFFNNYGAVGGALTTDSDMITEKELRAFADWFDESYSGSGNAGRTIALSHGLKYDRFMMSNLDMQFSEQRKDNRQRIQAVYGVNDAELGIFDSGMNRATSEQADRNVWEKSRLPLDRKVMETINNKWIKWLKPGNLILKSDTSQVEALKENYSERIKDSTELIQRGYVPPVEAFRVNGVPVDAAKYPWMEKVFAPMNLVDIELLADGAVFPSTPNAPPSTKHVIDLLSGVAKKRIESNTANDNEKLFKAIDIDELARAVAADDKEARDKMWSDYEQRILKPGDISMRTMIVKHLYRQRNEMLEKVDKWEHSQAEDKAMARELEISVNMFLFDLEDSEKDLFKGYSPEVRKQMDRELKHLKQQYGDVIQWKVTEPEIKKFIKQRSKITESIDTGRFNKAREQIGETVGQAINENLTVKETATAIREKITNLYPTNMAQATVIARTEISSVSNYSRMEAFEDAGAQAHEWLTARDELVRPTHQIDGEVRAIGELFSNGLRYPQDPAGSAESTINCRCITLLRLA